MRVWEFLLLLGIACNAQAFSWSDLWLTKDQQAQKEMLEGQFKQAETTFQQPDWRAAAAYRAGHYRKAAEQYQSLQNEISYYNQGNALAHLGKYEQAIKAYDKALAINPNNKDALYNRKLLAEMLKETKKQQAQNEQNKNQQGQKQQGKSQKGKNQQGQNQQGKSQEGKNQSAQNQQGESQESKNQRGENQQAMDQAGKSQRDGGKNQQAESQMVNQQVKAKKNEKNRKLAEKMQSAEQEKQQAKEQWLQLIPDDPGGLLREKFKRDHLRRQNGWYQ
jgi:Ca-activated chloride channel homolog